MMRNLLAAAALSACLAACGDDSRSAQPVDRPTDMAATPEGARPDAFAACSSCHQVSEGGRSGAGPNLWGIYGRSAGTVPGFFYSPALKRSGIRWDHETLDSYLAAPMAAVPGTRMRYAGMRDETQRRAIIDWLKDQQ